MTPKPEPTEGLAGWQQRCKAQGLALTASRKAILRALLEQTEPRDAVPLLQAAQVHHAGTSIGTVYRFLRELEQRGLLDAHLQAHGRTRWQLRETGLSSAAQTAGDIRRMVAQVQDFLRTLEQLGLAETTRINDSSSAGPPDSDRTLAVLHEIAGHLGYRLLPQRSTPA
jgi:DNA-binding PadR family transcriptional regulator